MKRLFDLLAAALGVMLLAVPLALLAWQVRRKLGSPVLFSCAAAGAACEHAHYKCYAYVQPERLAPGWTRDRIVEAIMVEGVPCYQGSCSEVYLEKAFDGTGWRPEVRLPVAQALGQTSIMFLVHPTLTQAEINKTCEAIRKVMVQASV